MWSFKPKFVSILYQVMFNDIYLHPSIKNRATLVKELLCTAGFEDVWLVQGVSDINYFLTILKTQIRDIF